LRTRFLSYAIEIATAIQRTIATTAPTMAMRPETVAITLAGLDHSPQFSFSLLSYSMAQSIRDVDNASARQQAADLTAPSMSTVSAATEPDPNTHAQARRRDQESR
jgi:hypothetical protein